MTKKRPSLLGGRFLISSLIFFLLILPQKIFGQNLRAVVRFSDRRITFVPNLYSVGTKFMLSPFWENLA